MTGMDVFTIGATVVVAGVAAAVVVWIVLAIFDR